MKVFTDFHHGDLYYSFQLLFEKRLGWELYRPIGTDWQSEGFWKIADPYGDNSDTIMQFLGISPGWKPKDQTPPLNDVSYKEGDVYQLFEYPHGTRHKAITLETFKEMDIDIVIASIPAHFAPFQRLIDLYKPKAKLICHFGNILWNVTDHPEVKNIMA
ncbi:MAG: hypothetical protein AABY22_16705, partial [Nanoarchaeota archaeon]